MFIEKTKDKTLERNYIQHWKFLIKEYDLIKEKKHPRFRFVTDFYKFYQTNRQNFLKYYHRFKTENNNDSLLPRKRGPKYNSRRPLLFIEKRLLKKELKVLTDMKLIKY